VSVVLVTGTDTGIGKTVVTCAIAAALAARATRVGVVKPVETGCPRVGDELVPEDATALAAAAGDPAPLAALCPHRLPDPLAPALAAERAGIAIDVAALAAHVRARAAAVDVLLVEGAGGLLVPLTRAASFADLARLAGARVVVVVGSRLGAINHALLTLEALETRGLPTAGYVINRLGGDQDLAVATNDDLLRRLTAIPCLGVVPWTPNASAVLADLRSGDPNVVAAARAHIARLAVGLDLDAV
jgi:dethiobiotin synthetase